MASKIKHERPGPKLFDGEKLVPYTLCLPPKIRDWLRSMRGGSQTARDAITKEYDESLKYQAEK